MTIRERQEQFEDGALSPYAQRSSQSRGREYPIEPCDVRMQYQRDRDRIVHCKSFRRLKYKTQVFLSPEGDHYRTRLTHTLEVSQIARTIARALRLNEDLTEAVALGHDLGHTPFGHVGESILNELLPEGFEHNKQSLRIVEKLESGRGLNLTWEVRDGILHHKKDGAPATLEGRIVSLADRIAYINHDIDDAVRARVLRADSLPAQCVQVLGGTHGERINTMVRDVIVNSQDRPEIRMSPGVSQAMEALRDFMFDRVYTDAVAKAQESKAVHVVEALFHYFTANSDRMPGEFLRSAQAEGVAVAAADYIALMTDRYAIRKYEELFVPKAWSEGAL